MAHAPADSRTGEWLKQVVTGYFAYHAVPTNTGHSDAFRHHVSDLWRRSLRRRSQKDGTTWERMRSSADDCLPKPRILHPWPHCALPSNTRGGSRVPEWGPLGSVRGALSNARPYRDLSGLTASSKVEGATDE